MGWFNKKKEIVKVWEYSTKGILWRIVPTIIGFFVGEDRDIKNVSFFCIDSNSGIERWRISFDEKWWIGIESIHRSYIIYHEYATPELPGHKNIHVVDSVTGNVLWSNYDLKYLCANGDYLYAERKEYFRNIYVEIDIGNGNIVREVDEKIIESLQRESSHTITDKIKFPVQINVLDDHSSKVKECYYFIKKKYSEPVFTEYIFHQQYIIMGYYLRSDVQENISAIPTNFTKQRAGKINVGMSIPPAFGGTKLVDNSWSGTSSYIQEIACYNSNNGKVIYRDVINTKTTVPLTDSFLMMNNYIYYVREKRTLIAMQIQTKL